MPSESLQDAYKLLKTEAEAKAEMPNKIRIEKEIAKMLKDLLENPKK